MNSVDKLGSRRDSLDHIIKADILFPSLSFMSVNAASVASFARAVSAFAISVIVRSCSGVTGLLAAIIWELDAMIFGIAFDCRLQSRLKFGVDTSD